jgi:hypothetical protein
MIDVKNPYEVRVVSFRKRRKFIAVDKPLEVVDKETGEVTTATPLVGNSSYRDTSPFVKLYDPSIFFRLKFCEVKVLAYAMDKMDYTGLFVMDVQSCSSVCDINVRTVYKSMTELVKQDVVRKKSRGMYWVNPNIACKGSRDGMNLVFDDETNSSLRQV